MQNLVNDATAAPKKNYDFIDAIRGIAMMSIVAEHCVGAGNYVFPIGSAKYWFNLCLIQFTKFGTIAFFLLAGFLIGEKFADYSPSQYLKRRISTTFGPWLFWSLIYLLAAIINLRIKARIYHDTEFNLNNVLEQVKIVYLFTNYWFIINFLVSISILLVFRRHLYSLFFGGVLLLFTLFYTVNIHYEWINPSHTTAILGFVFFLWLGAQLRKHWTNIEKWAAKFSYTLLIILILLTFALSIYEISELTNKSIDPVNSLRFSNILYSLVFFALLLRIKSFSFTTYLKPRQTTYGIYLIHYILVAFLLPEILMHLNIDAKDLSIPLFFIFKLITFLFIYSLTFYIVLLISNSRAKRLVGN